MRNINEIIIHCSATREGQHIPVETIKDWHVNGRGWSDIGYHFYIELDGTIKKGRDIDKTGAHCKNHNRNSIGVLCTSRSFAIFFEKCLGRYFEASRAI